MTDRNRLNLLDIKLLRNQQSQRTTLIILGFVCFWFCLYLNGFPYPTEDDLVFVGAAINLSQKGEFFNPLLSAWSERTVDRFFIQFPFHSYTLAGWLLLFGVGTRSLLLFQFTCYSIFSTFITVIFRKYKFSLATIITTVLIYALIVGGFGLRQDALGIAYMMVGLWSLTHDRIARYLIGFVFLGGSICTSPILVSYAAPLAIFLMIFNFRKQDPARLTYFLNRFIVLLISVLTIAFLLLWGIHFELFHFLEDISWHTSFRVAKPWNALAVVGFHIQHGYNSLVYGSLYITLLFLLGLLLTRRQQTKQSLKSLVAVLSIALTLNLLIYSGTFMYNFNLGCSILIFLILFNLNVSPLARSGLCLFTLLTFCIYQSPAIIAWLGQKESEPKQYQAALLWFKEHPQYNYEVDEVVARFVFDYRIPDGVTDWNYQTTPFRPQSLAEKPIDTVWMIAAAKGAVTKGLPKDYERVQLWGRQFNSIPKRPYDVMIVK